MTPHYTHGHDASVLAAHAHRTAADSAAYVLPHLVPGMNLLDIGYGPGTITLDLAASVAPGVVVGIENSSEPYPTARKNADLRSDVHTVFARGDVTDLPFPDASFDCVHAHQVLQHLSNPIRALTEMARVCTSDGWIAVRDADYSGMFWYPAIPGLENWRDLYLHIARANGGEPQAGRRLRSWAQGAPLTDLQITTSTWTYADPDRCHWWAESQERRISSPHFRSEAARQGYTEGDVDALVEAWRDWGASRDAFFVIPHTEILAHPAHPRPGMAGPEGHPA